MNRALLCFFWGLVPWITGGCLERREREEREAARAEDRCTSCHGEAQRPIPDASTENPNALHVFRSAPPRDLLGATDPSYPGVGAHTIHLTASATHAAFACTECHVVPERVDSPGHADDARPAELRFGPIAQSGARHPRYDPVAQTCADTHCHGDSGAGAVWSLPRASDAACGSCHGLPPPRPHPQSNTCSVCHGDVVDARGRIHAPALHVNGRVEFTAPSACNACHGEAANGAPPPDTLGNRTETAIGVGAHQTHLAGGNVSRPLACGECHEEPDLSDVSSHIDRLPAEVRFQGVAATDGRAPRWERADRTCVDTWCHGPDAEKTTESPSWVSTESLGCGSCHGNPPPAPHPAMNECASCHAEVIDEDGHVNRERHVDGRVDVDLGADCAHCHGDAESPAPPRDLSGATATTAPGVGAHRAHLTASDRARAVPCDTCHQVPSEVLDAGHVDSVLPAEVIFSGAANAFGGAARYVNGRCEDTACHGGAFPDQHASGGTEPAPTWTRVDGSQATCGSCHALPPPAPHPRADLNPTCNACHANIAPDNRTFLRPELHVDGVVTFSP